MIFHIRKRLRKLRGNQWYKDRDDRKVETYCQAEPTEYDVEWRYRKSKKYIAKWEHKSVVHYPCGVCREVVRDEEWLKGTSYG